MTRHLDTKLAGVELQEHVDDPSLLPIIIFPEGTCINNTSVMMFKKGSFEVSSTIYPIAMKYDSRLGDAFWNSSEQSYAEYLFRMMTSWAIMCDVWYLPPMSRDIQELLSVSQEVAEGKKDNADEICLDNNDLSKKQL
ncbi:unnamed protein product [Gongylonema pulchrum]|uniref:PlsC domain-containing protein n=1 Tax=Gongylonema pulchrum TaxID=637853 RepID=A0A183DST5_9BILA|nr:unnamed protein product [Gongylonema pulchrum]